MNNFNKYTIYIPIFIAHYFCFGVLLGYKMNVINQLSTKTDIGKNKIIRLLDLINREYVDKVNTDSIVDLTVNGILEKLRSSSVYIPKRVFGPS